MATNENVDHELVVAADGSIPADQLKRLGVSPGTHLRVVETPASALAGSIAGSLSHLADVSWEDFQCASELAHDVLLVTRDQSIRDSGLVPTIW